MIIYLGCVATYLWASTLQWILARRAGALAPPPNASLYPRIQKGLIVGSFTSGLLFVLYLVTGLTK